MALQEETKVELTKEEIDRICEENGYNMPVFIEGKGWCCIAEFIFTIAIIVGLNKHDYNERFCYPKIHARTLIVTLASWKSLLENGEPVPEQPEDSYWVKRKGKSGEWGNPKAL